MKKRENVLGISFVCPHLCANKQMVDLWIHGHGKVNSLPLENMPAWQYLSEVIVPGSLGLLCIENASVNASIGYYVMGGIKMFEFNYENRLTAMESVMAQPGCLVAKLCDKKRKRRYMGNASKADTDCCICLEPRANFRLEKCIHCFHDACLVNWSQDTCPLCRLPHSLTDRKNLMVSLLQGLFEGKIVALPS
jgi:hypothetical protein